jgi:hypothetical protein
VRGGQAARPADHLREEPEATVGPIAQRLTLLATHSGKRPFQGDEGSGEAVPSDGGGRCAISSDHHPALRRASARSTTSSSCRTPSECRNAAKGAADRGNHFAADPKENPLVVTLGLPEHLLQQAGRGAHACAGKSQSARNGIGPEGQPLLREGLRRNRLKQLPARASSWRCSATCGNATCGARDWAATAGDQGELLRELLLAKVMS